MTPTAAEKVRAKAQQKIEVVRVPETIGWGNDDDRGAHNGAMPNVETVDADDDAHVRLYESLGPRVMSPPTHEDGTKLEEPRARRWRRCRDLVETILKRADEKWIELRLGGQPIASVRPGGIVLGVGGSGSGKSSFAASIGIEHALDYGTTVVLSLELPGDEWTARAIGTRCDASWPDVLQGRVPREHMLARLPERLVVLDREYATLPAFDDTIVALQGEYPGEPVFGVVDYAQLLEVPDEKEIRVRVGRVMRELDKIARSRGVVMLVLSQGSRASARALANGDAIGAGTTDAGAESADLERWASLTIAIGAKSTPDEDGSCSVELSVGKSRMGRGDVVFPARYHGRSGLWRLTGEARSAAEVRAERSTANKTKRTTTAALAVSALLAKAKEPMFGPDIVRELGIERGIVYAAIRDAREAGSVVRVKARKRGGNWPVWSAAKVAEAQLEVVPEGVDE
jgi:hypothetical protein